MGILQELNRSYFGERNDPVSETPTKYTFRITKRNNTLDTHGGIPFIDEAEVLPSHITDETEAIRIIAGY